MVWMNMECYFCHQKHFSSSIYCYECNRIDKQQVRRELGNEKFELMLVKYGYDRMSRLYKKYGDRIR